MLKYYMANADKAGVGLECLPGVKQLLQELKVHHLALRMCETGPRVVACLSICFVFPSSCVLLLFHHVQQSQTGKASACMLPLPSVDSM